MIMKRKVARLCEIKFSEQFLVSIGEANRMVGIYSAKDEKRFLITPRPYGVENSFGVSISFRLRNDLGYSQLCRAGETCRLLSTVTAVKYRSLK